MVAQILGTAAPAIPEHIDAFIRDLENQVLAKVTRTATGQINA